MEELKKYTLRSVAALHAAGLVSDDELFAVRFRVNRLDPELVTHRSLLLDLSEEIDAQLRALAARPQGQA